MCARHLQYLALKMAETLFFSNVLKKKTSPRLQTVTCFSNTENQNCTGKMDMVFFLNLTLWSKVQIKIIASLIQCYVFFSYNMMCYSKHNI